MAGATSPDRLWRATHWSKSHIQDLLHYLLSSGLSINGPWFRGRCHLTFLEMPSAQFTRPRNMARLKSCPLFRGVSTNLHYRKMEILKMLSSCIVFYVSEPWVYEGMRQRIQISASKYLLRCLSAQKLISPVGHIYIEFLKVQYIHMHIWNIQYIHTLHTYRWRIILDRWS